MTDLTLSAMAAPEMPQIERIPIDRLKLWKKNARTHSSKQVRQIADSIKEFGFTNPVLIDEGGTILAGHGRVAAAKELGFETVPCVRFDHLSETQKRAYVLADNKLALNAGWDEGLLGEELAALMEIDDGIDLSLTGFSFSEIDNLIDGIAPEDEGDPADDELPDDADVETRCNPGDVFQLGPHRLFCGDACDPETLRLLMDGERARIAFTDPPYNVPIDGHGGNSGKTQHREFAMASGEMSPQEFTDFLNIAFQGMAGHNMDGAIHFVCMDWRHKQEMMLAGDGVYSELKNLIVWVKDNGGMGAFYRSRHELIFAFKVGTAPHVNTFELGQHGRYQTNVWEYRGISSLSADRMGELQLHPTVKPVEMIANAIKDVSGRGDIVLDPFGGSGSTLIVAHKTGRRGYLAEIDPVYCDRIIACYEAYANDEAQKIVSGSNEASTPILEATK